MRAVPQWEGLPQETVGSPWEVFRQRLGSCLAATWMQVRRGLSGPGEGPREASVREAVVNALHYAGGWVRGPRRTPPPRSRILWKVTQVKVCQSRGNPLSEPVLREGAVLGALFLRGLLPAGKL